MMRSQSDKFFYLLAGSFAGAVVALLFAPQSGSKTRKQVRKYSREAGNRAQEFVGALAETLDEALMDVLDADVSVEDANTQIEAIKTEAKVAKNPEQATMVVGEYYDFGAAGSLKVIGHNAEGKAIVEVPE